MAVVLGEGLYQRALIPAGAPGRPVLPVFAGGAAAVAAATALLNAGGADAPALVVGGLASVGLLASCVQRALSVQGRAGDWPGPQAWPATLGLISFFSVCIHFGALKG